MICALPCHHSMVQHNLCFFDVDSYLFFCLSQPALQKSLVFFQMASRQHPCSWEGFERQFPPCDENMLVFFPEDKDTGTRLVEFLGLGKVRLMKRTNVRVSEPNLFDNFIILMLLIDSLRGCGRQYQHVTLGNIPNNINYSSHSSQKANVPFGYSIFGIMKVDDFVLLWKEQERVDKVGELMLHC